MRIQVRSEAMRRAAPGPRSDDRKFFRSNHIERATSRLSHSPAVAIPELAAPGVLIARIPARACQPRANWYRRSSPPTPSDSCVTGQPRQTARPGSRCALPTGRSHPTAAPSPETIDHGPVAITVSFPMSMQNPGFSSVLRRASPLIPATNPNMDGRERRKNFPRAPRSPRCRRKRSRVLAFQVPQPWSIYPLPAGPQTPQRIPQKQPRSHVNRSPRAIAATNLKSAPANTPRHRRSSECPARCTTQPYLFAPTKNARRPHSPFEECARLRFARFGKTDRRDRPGQNLRNTIRANRSHLRLRSVDSFPTRFQQRSMRLPTSTRRVPESACSHANRLQTPNSRQDVQRTCGRPNCIEVKINIRGIWEKTRGPNETLKSARVAEEAEQSGGSPPSRNYKSYPRLVPLFLGKWPLSE
jgi:hypothetical protein